MRMAQLVDTMQESSRIAPAAKAQSLDKSAYPKLLESKLPTPSRRYMSLWLLLLLAAVATATLTGWWLHARHFESTDDAQIEGHLNSISARISGDVAYINPNVQNNQYVEAGTLLLELDPNDYQVALDHAKADLVKREATARSAAVNVPITDVNAFSQLHAAQAARDEAAASVVAEEANFTAAQHKI